MNLARLLSLQLLSASAQHSRLIVEPSSWRVEIRHVIKRVTQPSRFTRLAQKSGCLKTSILNDMAGQTKHPLFGFLPRNVTAKQVQGVVVCGRIVSVQLIVDVLAGRQRKSFHSHATFASIS